MKRLSMYLLLCLGITLILQACTKSSTLYGNAAVSLPCPSCTNYTGQQFGGINLSTARMLARDYRQINIPLLEAGEGGLQDATSVWLSLETLKSYISKIESAACVKGCGDKMNLGVRIYYGRYPEISGWNNDLEEVPDNYAEHHTIFMVPTYQDALNGSVQWDFDPWHWGNNSCTPTSLAEWFRLGDKPFGAEKSLVLSPSERQVFKAAGNSWVPAQNHGSLIPPELVTGTSF